MIRGVHTLTVVSMAALIAFSAFAFTRRLDVREWEHYEQQLRSLLALDFRLSAEVMKARSGLIAHYDGIVQTEAARKRIHRALADLPGALRMRDAGEIGALLAAGEQALDQSERLVERFKRENAVLRNSLRFLPVLAAEVDAIAPLGPATRTGANALIAGLVRDELLLQTWQDRAVIERIDRALDTLTNASTSASEPSRSMLTTVVAHARIVRDRTPIVRELTRSIMAADDAGQTQATMAAFLRHRQALLQVADSDATVRFALALLALASLAASIILRLRNAAADLRLTSARLTHAVTSLRAEQGKQKELSELKSRFVSMASHEFRTPLSVIMSSSELLEAYGERWPEAKKQDHFVRIRQAALGMTRMLEAILMIGRRDSGLLKFEPRPVEIGSFCSDVLQAVGDATGQAKRFVYRGPAAAEHVLADPTLLRHVLENLLSNALKYSPADSAVELDVARDHAELRFDVRDHGIGISEEDQRHLFETFHRGKNVGSISGTGLGLAIVHGAVQLHGGSIAARSELSVGTQFTVRIPCERSEA